MQNIQIKTPQNVNVSIQHAGVGWRIAAFMIDLVIIFLYFILLNLTFASLGVDNFNFFNNQNADINIFWSNIYTLLTFPALFYSLWTEYFFNGQTLGKMICKIKVVKINGYKATFQEYFTRWAFRFVDFWTGLFLSLFFIPIFGLDIALILMILMLYLSGLVAVVSISRTKNSQRIGDIIAGTTVLKLKEKHSIDITILEELKEDYKPKYSQVLKLSDNDARIIKDTFISAKKNRDIVTLSRLRAKLESVMEVKGDEEDIDFIETVMKDFNYYTQKL